MIVVVEVVVGVVTVVVTVVVVVVGVETHDFTQKTIKTL